MKTKQRYYRAFTKHSGRPKHLIVRGNQAAPFYSVAPIERLMELDINNFMSTDLNNYTELREVVCLESS